MFLCFNYLSIRSAGKDDSMESSMHDDDSNNGKSTFGLAEIDGTLFKKGNAKTEIISRFQILLENYFREMSQNPGARAWTTHTL
jgi:hypothetical protein